MMTTIDKLRTLLADLDGILLLDEQNRRYATRMQTSAGAVYITKKEAYFLTDFRYIEAARRACAGFEVLEQKGALTGQLAQLMAGAKRVGFEDATTTVSQYGRLAGALPVEFVPVSRQIMELRSIKDSYELECIRAAQKITDETFAYVLEHIRPGMTERALAALIEYQMRLRGADGPAFDTIAVSGKNTSLPHGVPSDKPIESGDFVTMDFGAKARGYCSDMTRTVAVGRPTEKMRQIYGIVLEANRRALAGVQTGMTGAACDALARGYIAQQGYGDRFGHGLGHSLGLEIHEEPRFSPACETVILPDTVVTVEPGIYLENEFGVRIEDMVWMTPDGPVNLTASPKELIVL